MTTTTYRRIAPGTTEHRTADFTATDNDGRWLEGYAAVTNVRTRIRDAQGDFDETILPGAFRRSIERRMPVLQFDHGKDPRIGGTPIGKIHTLKEDTKGLYVRARLFSHPDVDRVREAIAEGAITGMSFRFSVPQGGDSWSARSSVVDLREIREADCHELGPVVFPAYDATTVSVRSAAGRRGAGETEVVGYVARWNEELLTYNSDGERAWMRITPGAFDDWLYRLRGRVPIMINHGREPLSLRRAAVLEKPAGWWYTFERDQYGLLARGHLDLSTAQGVAVAERIASGEWQHLSFHAQIMDSRAHGTRGGYDRLELRELHLTEAGPTPTPVDEGAVILTLGGEPVGRGRRIGTRVPTYRTAEAFTETGRSGSFAELVREMEDVVGINLTAEANKVGMRKVALRQRAEDRVDRMMNIAAALKKARQAAVSEARWAAGTRQPGAFGRFLDLRREAEGVERDLLAAALGDRSTVERLERDFDMEPLPSVLGAARAGWRR